MVRALLLAATMVALLLSGCGEAGLEPDVAPDAESTATGETTPTEVVPESSAPARVLVITETAGFVHGSIPKALEALREIDAGDPDLELVFRDRFAGLSTELDDVDAVAFVLTSGELPSSEADRAALLGFVVDGGGFLGVHSAVDTFYEFPGYQRLIGDWLRDHPYSDGSLVVVADHPATVGLPESIDINEELYRVRSDPRQQGMVPLLELRSVDGAPDGEYLPSAWCGRVGGGRTLYSALGHFDETWQSEWFRGHIAGALGWAAGTRPSTACD